jgi:hypothetical protein
MSSGPSRGRFQFQDIGTAGEQTITYPTSCWISLGPYLDVDLPEGATQPGDGNENMTPVVRTGNFTLVSHTAKAVETHAYQPPDMWERLSPLEQTAIVGGVYVVLAGCLVAVIVVARRRGRWLEDPMNPAYQGLFVAGKDNKLLYKPNLPGGEPGLLWMRNIQLRKGSRRDASISQQRLLGGDDH